MSFNCYNLLHILNDIRNFRPLDNFSAFPFENHIRKVKQLVRKGDKPLYQIARRLAEIKAANEISKSNEYMNPLILEKNHSEGQVLKYEPEISQFKILKKEKLYINCNDTKNNCILLEDGSYVECYNFIKINENIYIVGKKLKLLGSFYTAPINSKFFFLFTKHKLLMNEFHFINILLNLFYERYLRYHSKHIF